MTTSAREAHALYTGPPFGEARVHDAMRVGIITCRPETCLRDVARMMVSYGIHSVVVHDMTPGAHPWGIVTTLDIAASADRDLEELRAEDVASTDVLTVPANETLEEAAKLMTSREITHLVVVEPATEWPCGMLSARDLARVLTAPRASAIRSYAARTVARVGDS